MKQLILIVSFLCFDFQLYSQELSKEYNETKNVKRFTFDFGLGVGYANQVDPLFYKQDYVFGTSFATNIEYQFSQKFKAGVSLYLWYESGQMFQNNNSRENQPNNYRQSILANVFYYPGPKNKLFFDAGIGAGNFFFTPEEPLPLSDGSWSASSVIDVGFSSTLGLGYEMKTGRKTFLVPSLNFYFTSLGDLEVFPDKIENSSPSVVFEFRLSFMLQALLQK